MTKELTRKPRDKPKPYNQQPRVQKVEELMESLHELRRRNRVFGELPDIDDLVDSVHEKKDAGESPYAYENPDKDIIEQVQYEMRVKNGEIDEKADDDDDDPDDDELGHMSRTDTIDLCQQLERLTLKFGDSSTSLELTSQLRKFGAFLYRDLHKATQKSLDDFMFVSHSS